jgi:mono/diheme cytochrome c family protein
MIRVLRWVAFALAALVVVAIVAYGAIYVLSSRSLDERFPIPKVTIAVPADEASIAEGRRLATIRGCVDDCHGKDAAGGVMFDQPMIARIVAPNLTAAVRRYSDAELVGVIRNGVRPDGRSVMVMPSEAFVDLSDADTGRIIAFLRSLPPAPGPDAGVTPGPLGRIGLATGKFRTSARILAESAPLPEAKDEEAKVGRYLARTTCGGCHAPDLHGMTTPTFTSADLAIVAAYSPEAFATLLRTGKALGGRELGLMSPFARRHLALLTDSEIAALYAYLHTLPPKASPS